MDAPKTKPAGPAPRNVPEEPPPHPSLCGICYKERVPCATDNGGRCIRCALLAIQKDLRERQSETLHGLGIRTKEPQEFVPPAVPASAVASDQSPPSRKRKKPSQAKGDTPQPWSQEMFPGPPRPMIHKPGSRQPVGKGCPPEPAGASTSADDADKQTDSHGTDAPASSETETVPGLDHLNSSQGPQAKNVISPNCAASAALLDRFSSVSLEALSAFNAAAARAATAAFRPSNAASGDCPQTSAGEVPASDEAGSSGTVPTTQLSSLHNGNGDVSNWSNNDQSDPIGINGTANALNASGLVAGQNPPSHFSSPGLANDSVSSASSGVSSRFGLHDSNFGYGAASRNTFSGSNPAVWPGYNTNATDFLMNISPGSDGSASPFSFGDYLDRAAASLGTADPANIEAAMGEPLTTPTAMGEDNFGTGPYSAAFEASCGLWNDEDANGRLRCMEVDCEVTFDSFESLRDHYVLTHAKSDSP